MARRAEEARDKGQVVQAYMLYVAAAARDPRDHRYAANRDALAPAAKLLEKGYVSVQNTDISEDLKAAEAARNNPTPPIELASRADWEKRDDLRPIPVPRADTRTASFDVRGDDRLLYQQVARVYGLEVTFDPRLQPRPGLHFAIENADYKAALEAVAVATETFVFPISEKHLFVARNTDEKRTEFEPQVLLTFNLPEVLDQKDLVEAANAVRTVMNIRAIGWDSASRTVMVRDRATRAHAAFDLLTAVLLPRPELSLEVQIIAIDSERNYHYGLALPTSYEFGYIGQAGGLKNAINFGTSLTLLTLGGGSSIFGLGLTNSTLFATFTDSYSHTLYDATVRVSGNQTATLHVGDQYPIAQSIYTGFSQSTPSIYNPAPQISLVDLGLLLKMSPHLGSDGNVAMEVEAAFKALGSQTFNTVPTILDREFKASVNLREGESAVIAGMDADTSSVTRNGLIGISQIPGLNQVLSENTRDRQISHTLIVIKPTILRLPLSPEISPQFFVGPQRGEATLF